MQSPSSLIFLVLLGVWAAYFAQYWLRRRDHLATARSVEQFSEAMRVLERRQALPRTDLLQPAPPSYAGHPARAVRPQVLVKRAVAAQQGAIGVTERVRSEDAPPPREVSEPPPAVAPAVAPAPAPVPARAARPARQGGSARPPRVRPSRRLRGLVLLAALVELLVIVPLVLVSLLPLWGLAPAVLAVVWAFLWVRSAVRAERVMALAHRRRPERGRSSSRASSAEAARARGGVSGERARAVPGRADVDDHPAPTAGTEVDGISVRSAVEARREEVYDAERSHVVPEVAPTGDVMVPIVDEDDIPLTWDPVPVPRPTYTMKAKADRPEVAPAAVTPDPEPVRHERAGDGTAYERRRVAGA